MEPLLTPADVRRHLQVSESTFYRLRQDPLFPRPVYLGSRIPRWEPTAIRRWVEMTAAGAVVAEPLRVVTRRPPIHRRKTVVSAAA